MAKKIDPQAKAKRQKIIAAVAATGITMDGYTYSQPAVARLLTRLSVVPDLVNVQLQQSTLSKIGATPVVHFTIAADVRKPGGAS